MFEGRRSVKNLVKVDLREPDPAGYIRNIHSIKISENIDEQSLMYNANSSLVKTVYIEITAKAFMRG